MNAFDDRLIKLTLTFPDGRIVSYDQRFFITAIGEKLAHFNQGDCNVRIDNIDEKTRNTLITLTSPFAFPRAQIVMLLEVGRKSYGTFTLFQGNVWASNPTQPPDIGLTLQAFNGPAVVGQNIALSLPPTSQLSVVSQRVATELGKTLNYMVSPDKAIDNFSFTGPTERLVQKLMEAGNVRAFIDNEELVVMNGNAGRNQEAIVINPTTGMVGVPMIDESGVLVRMLIHNQIRVGNLIKIESEINPAADGEYVINNLGYEVASRDVPFYWLAQCRPAQYTPGFRQ